MTCHSELGFCLCSYTLPPQGGFVFTLLTISLALVFMWSCQKSVWWRDLPCGPVDKSPRSQCLIFGQETRSHMLQQRLKILSAAAKTQRVQQINKSQYTGDCRSFWPVYATVLVFKDSLGWQTFPFHFFGYSTETLRGGRLMNQGNLLCYFCLCPKRLLWLWIFLVLFHNLHFWAPSWMCHSLKPKLVTSLSFLSVLVQSEGETVSCSFTSDSLRPHRLYPTRLLCPWDSPGKNTGVGSHSLLQGSVPIQGLNPGLLHCRQILYRLSHKGSLHHCSKP